MLVIMETHLNVKNEKPTILETRTPNKSCGIKGTAIQSSYFNEPLLTKFSTALA